MTAPINPSDSGNADAKSVNDYVNASVGLSRTALNTRATFGIIIFGWLMVMNYDDLDKKGFGWAFLIAMGFVFAIARQSEPMVGILGPVIYVAAWVHTNLLLTEKQRIARARYYAGKA